jgi:hypothetical protein
MMFFHVGKTDIVQLSRESVGGTFDTCRLTLTMSAVRG